MKIFSPLRAVGAACVALLLVTASPSTLAAAINCSGVLKNKVVSGTVAPALDCIGVFGGNLVKDSDPALAAFGETWDLLVKDQYSDDSPVGFNGTLTSALIITDDLGDPNAKDDVKSGTWAIDPSKVGTDSFGNPYNTFVIGFKIANGAAYWLVDDLSGTFSGLTHGLSHANLYAIHTAVPVPAAVWLFGSALLGLGAIARKRR